MPQVQIPEQIFKTFFTNVKEENKKKILLQNKASFLLLNGPERCKTCSQYKRSRKLSGFFILRY